MLDVHAGSSHAASRRLRTKVFSSLWWRCDQLGYSWSRLVTRILGVITYTESSRSDDPICIRPTGSELKQKRHVEFLRALHRKNVAMTGLKRF